jgi:Fic family protein
MSWIFHDTALEGVVYTFEELSSALRRAPDPTDSAVLPVYDAIRRHRQAIAFIREQAEKKRSNVTIDLIKQIYIILHPDEGDVKTVKYRRDVPQHRLYFHEYAPPDKIAYKIRQVTDWVNHADTRRDVGVIKMAAKAHYDLARAYPFPNDSGKVARLFMNMLLLGGGMPPAIIHATQRQPYYEALKSTTASAVVRILRDALANSLASTEKMLDEYESSVRGFAL